MSTHQPHPEQNTQANRPEGNTAITAWRLLCIEPDVVDSLKLKLTLHDQLPTGSILEHATSFEEGQQLFQQQPYDAVLIGIPCANAQNLDAIKSFTAECDGAEVIVLSGGENMNAAVAAGRCGANSFHLKSRQTPKSLDDALRRAIQGSAKTTDIKLAERRKEHHYPLSVAAVIFPIEADGTPGREIAATTVDISQHGIAVLTQANSEQVPDICVVGVECPDGAYRYATVEWRHRRLALPSLCFGGRFLQRTDDPLHASRLTPRFDPNRFRFRPDMDSTALREWIARGILRPLTVDRVKVCPQCESLLTFREGCPDCGSTQTEVCQLIHHFACAHVAPAEEFDGESLSCPKCRLQNLVVGADFEYLVGPQSCLECEWSDALLELIAECLKCGHRFSGCEAVEKEVYEYHVDRLDPLALIDRA